MSDAHEPPADDGSGPFGEPLPEGQYDLSFQFAVRATAYRRRVLWGLFVVVDDGPHLGRELYRFWNAPTGAYLSRRSSLWLDFLAVTGRRPPSQPFDPSWAFSGCWVRAQVVTVTSRVENGQRVPMLEPERYSKVERLVSLVSGKSPALRGEGMKPLNWKKPKT